MGVGTLGRYLLGGREAILAVASSRHALWLGLLFVLSAGFAREYDGKDLLHEPGHLLLPLGASLLSSLLLFTVLNGCQSPSSPGTPAEGRPPWGSRYLLFLGLFWMTAPLAWLYAVPYERFLGPAESTYANLITLGVVAAWRVALMVRVGVVVFGLPLWVALSAVMCFADGAALLSIAVVSVRMMSIMGGMHLTESERVLSRVTDGVGALGCYCLPVWLILAVMGLAAKKSPAPALQPGYGGQARPGRGLCLLAVGSVLVWALVLPLTQPEQQRRYRVERAMARGDFAGALAEMSAHSPSDYPPHWDPPPRRFASPVDHWRLLDILEEVARTPPAPWVQEVYLRKLRGYVRNSGNIWSDTPVRLARLFQRLPGGMDLLEEFDQEFAEEDERNPLSEVKRLLQNPKELEKQEKWFRGDRTQ